MTKPRNLLGFLIVFSACKGADVAKPTTESRFKMPARIEQTTWAANARERALTDSFLRRFSTRDADWYREMLLRSDATIKTPHDTVAQKLLNQIYEERWNANEQATNLKRGK